MIDADHAAFMQSGPWKARESYVVSASGARRFSSSEGPIRSRERVGLARGRRRGVPESYFAIASEVLRISSLEDSFEEPNRVGYAHAGRERPGCGLLAAQRRATSLSPRESVRKGEPQSQVD